LGPRLPLGRLRGPLGGPRLVAATRLPVRLQRLRRGDRVLRHLRILHPLPLSGRPVAAPGPVLPAALLADRCPGRGSAAPGLAPRPEFFAIQRHYPVEPGLRRNLLRHLPAPAAPAPPPRLGDVAGG